MINFFPIDEREDRFDPCHNWHKQIGVRIVTENVNAKMCQILGRERPEIVGRSIFDPSFVDEENAAVYANQIKARRRGEGGSYEINLRNASGEKVPVQVEAIPSKVQKETGRVLQSLGMFVDLTDRKKAEEQREYLISELNRANEELKDFAYIVSHDLKAPLRAISSLAEWIVKDYSDVIDEDGRENLALLLARTRRMNNLIEGILRYSRVGRLKPEKGEQDTMKIVRVVIDSLAPPKDVAVTVDGALPPVVYDKTHLEQVFQNLISNAIKHIGKPRGQVTVSCQDGGEKWEFHVKDDGVGIEEKHFDRIFKIFQSLKPRDEVESTGIGLTLVKKIIETNGGKIWVQSVVGEGSEFIFTIPKQDALAQESEQETTARLEER
ncbi:MAG: PAS domain S-box protein [Nitrospinae bacterium]|nr:PAS domain S-box protein [Nitrospinota bacterium]